MAELEPRVPGLIRPDVAKPFEVAKNREPIDNPDNPEVLAAWEARMNEVSNPIGVPVWPDFEDGGTQQEEK